MVGIPDSLVLRTGLVGPEAYRVKPWELGVSSLMLQMCANSPSFQLAHEPDREDVARQMQHSRH